MPTYVYRRPDGTVFEVFQKISDPALTEDPETGVPIQRVISGGAGLQFKGDGFYLTDYARKDAGKAGEAAKQSEDSGDGASKETKPATTKSEPKSTGESGE